MGGIDVTLSSGAGEVGLSLPFSAISSWFQGLRDTVAESRAADADPSLRVFRVTRMSCPACSASVFSLTVVERDGEQWRACRACRSEFQVGM